MGNEVKKPRKKSVPAIKMAVKGTVVKGKAGTRTKVVTPRQAKNKALLKRAEALAAGSAKLVQKTGGVVKPKVKKKVVVKPKGRTLEGVAKATYFGRRKRKGTR